MENSIVIPDDLLSEILLRLPVKSLIRFTCVCKYWLSIIKSPQFASKHYNTSLNRLLQHDDCIYKSQSLLVHLNNTTISTSISRFNIFDYETLKLSTVFECKPVNSHDLLLPKEEDHERIDWNISGPCNGLFCVHFGRYTQTILLWNPSTREVFKAAYSPSISTSFVGFGYDSRTNDYKIVTICHNTSSSKVYSLITNSWRDIDHDHGFGPSKSLYSYTKGTCNGRMCSWLGCLYDPVVSKSVYFLLSFDMVDECFVETPIPEFVVGCSQFIQQRSHLEHPAMYAFDLEYYDYENEKASLKFLDVWVLDGYGSTGCWTKHHSITMPPHIMPLLIQGSWKNQAVFYVDNLENPVLNLYSPVTQEQSSLPVPGDELFGYTESLFSIKAVCQHPTQDHLEDATSDVLFCLCEAGRSPTPKSYFRR